MGRFWVDLFGKPKDGVKVLSTPELWESFHKTMDTARTAERWK